jgi:transposase
VIDAGYYSENNLQQLANAKIHFMIRMPDNRKHHKELTEKYGAVLFDMINFVKYNDRYLFIKKVPTIIYSKKYFTYLILDQTNMVAETRKLCEKFTDKKISIVKANSKLKNKGITIILSTDNANTTDILPVYYTRSKIEQFFDISKNNSDFLPLRVHSLETFRGHLLVSFFASTTYFLINKKIGTSKFCAIDAFSSLDGLFVKIQGRKQIIQELTKNMKSIINNLQLELPDDN